MIYWWNVWFQTLCQSFIWIQAYFTCSYILACMHNYMFYVDARVCSCKLTTSAYIRWGNYLLKTEQHLATSSCFSLQFSSRILVILSQLPPHCIYEWTDRKREIQKDRERGKERGEQRGTGRGDGEFNFRTTRNSPSFTTASKNKLCSL